MVNTKSFDAYEIIGVIVPGTVVALLLMLEWPELKALVGSDGLSVGDLGLFLILAFILGHLLQAVGNLVDGLIWLIPGMPTAWVRKPKQGLISRSQRVQLERLVSEMESEPTVLSDMTRAEWRTVIQRMYVRVSSAGQADKIDTFNRTYGLFRGLTAAFLLMAVWYSVSSSHDLLRAGIALLLAGAAVARLVRVAIHYARTLMLCFIETAKTPSCTRPMSAFGAKRSNAIPRPKT